MSSCARLWDNQLVSCTILKRVGFMRLIRWKHHIFDGSKMLYTTTLCKWYPVWRVFEQEDAA